MARAGWQMTLRPDCQFNFANYQGKLSGPTEQMPDHGADKQDQKNKEQDFGDSSGGESHTGKTEKRRDQSENKEA